VNKVFKKIEKGIKRNCKKKEGFDLTETPQILLYLDLEQVKPAEHFKPQYTYYSYRKHDQQVVAMKH
jgi:tRNA U54 and U55 pseudouridine synthase Pus10